MISRSSLSARKADGLAANDDATEGLGGLACLTIGVVAARYAPQIHARFFAASGA